MNRRTPINLTTNCCLVHYFKQPRLSSVQLSIFFISSTTLHGLSLKSSSTTAWLSQDFSWPGWVDLVASVSHLALTVSSSLSFYIYFALYGAKHKVVVVVVSIGRCRYILEYLLKLFITETSNSGSAVNVTKIFAQQTFTCKWQSIWRREREGRNTMDTVCITVTLTIATSHYNLVIQERDFELEDRL